MAEIPDEVIGGEHYNAPPMMTTMSFRTFDGRAMKASSRRVDSAGGVAAVPMPPGLSSMMTLSASTPAIPAVAEEGGAANVGRSRKVGVTIAMSPLKAAQSRREKSFRVSGALPTGQSMRQRKHGGPTLRKANVQRGVLSSPVAPARGRETSMGQQQPAHATARASRGRAAALATRSRATSEGSGSDRRTESVRSTTTSRHSKSRSSEGSKATSLSERDLVDMTSSLAVPDPEYSSTPELAGILAKWLCGVVASRAGGSDARYNSVTLFTEVRLHEIEAMAGHTESPNKIRAAVAVSLFDVLLNYSNMGAVKFALSPIHAEAMRCIYTKPGMASINAYLNSREIDAKHKLDGNRPDKGPEISYKFIHGLLVQVLGAETHFDRIKELEAEMEFQANRAEHKTNLAVDAMRRRCAAEAKTNLSRKLLMARCYYNWALVQKIRKAKHVLSMFRSTKLQNPISLRDVFNALKRHADGERRRRQQNGASAMAQQYETELKELRDQLSSANQEIERLKQDAQLREALIGRYEKERSTHAAIASLAVERAEQQSKLADLMGALTRHAVDTSVRLTSSTVDEVKEIPDASLLRTVLRNRDLNLGAIAEQYRYGGTGAVEVVADDDDDDDDAFAVIAAEEIEVVPPPDSPSPAGKSPWKGGTKTTTQDSAAAALKKAKLLKKAASKLKRSTARHEKTASRSSKKPKSRGGSKGRRDSSREEKQEESIGTTEPVEAGTSEVDLSEMSAAGGFEDDLEIPSAAESPAISEPPSDNESDNMQDEGVMDLTLPHIDLKTAYHALENADVPLVIMRWANYHLSHAKFHGDLYKKRLHNFGSDMAGAEALGLVLRRVAPDVSWKIAIAPDPFHRSELVVDALTNLYPSATDFITPEDVFHGDEELGLATMCRLFTTHPGLNRPDAVVKPLQERVSVVLKQWTGVVDEAATRGIRMTKSFALTDATETAIVVPDEPGTTPDLNARVDRARAALLSPKDIEQAASTMSEFARHLTESTEVINAAAVEGRAGMYLWRGLHAKAVGHLWNVFRSKILRKPEPVIDEREAKALKEYTTIYPFKYRDLLDRYCTSQADAETQVDAIQAVLKSNRGPMSRIFQYYCASGDGASISSMCLSEYWAFLRDSKVAHGGFGDKKSARLDLIFHKCNRPSGLEDEDDNIPKKELTPRQFVESVVRIAVLIFERDFPKQTLAGCLQKLLDKYVVPNAIQSNTEHWRGLLYSEPVRKVFTAHRILLQKVFATYAKGDGTEAVSKKKSKTINISDFLRLLRDIQAMDKTLTALAVKHIFAHTQIEEVFTDDVAVGGGEEEMIYSEFLEGVGCVAMFKYCSPYVGVEKRIDSFIVHYIQAKAKLPGGAVAAKGAGAGKKSEKKP